MQLVNLTQHDIVLVLPTGEYRIPPYGQVARVAVTREVAEHLPVSEDYGQIGDGGDALGESLPPRQHLIPIHRTVFGAVEGLPDPRPFVQYIVSRVVAEAARDRDDLLIPDDTVRDEQGRIIGCRALARL